MPTFLALGDSYSIGEGVVADASWPMRLAARLRANGLAIDDPRIIATTGWTTDELATAMDAATIAPPCALVSLMVGVNDQYRGRALDETLRTFDELLQRAIALAGDDAARVIVPSIPDWSATPFGHASGRDPAEVSAQIDAFNRGEHDIVARRGARWIDVTRASRAMANDPTLIVDDGLHPSPTMHDRWVQIILPTALSVLGAAMPINTNAQATHR